MQAKWEQIFISTFVLCLCERLASGAQVGGGGLQVHKRPDPSADVSPPEPMLKLLELKSTSEACASEVLHDDWLNL